ncbi:MAG: vWA domain-containing protein [Candidatus Hodarchaeales archaeon]|jgi:hypothetical protein
MAIRDRLKSRNYYWEAIREHKRTVALISALMVTLPLFVFTALPPVEVVVENYEEVLEEVPVEIEIEVNVTKEIQVPVNITEEVVVNTTIEVNVTEGGSVFLAPQPPPPFLDSDIVLCIDTSGSMDANRMPLAKSAISSLLKQLNRSYSAGLSDDRVALVSFNASAGDWTTDAVIRSDLDFVGNNTHLNDVNDTTFSLTGSGGTDAWAGLNYSLNLLFNNQRNTSALKSIILLTDGEHNTGPWGVEVGTNGNYTGFMQLPANNGPYSESPIVQARDNDVKIYSIGLFEGVAYDFDEYFLRNISLDPDYGAFGDFFAGNDTLSLTESFLRARDQASGWSPVILNDTVIVGNGSRQLFTFNVTGNTRKLKWDLNWDNSSIDFNITAIDPNGTVIPITTNITENVIPLTNKQPKSVILDFPVHGIWQFNISWTNITAPELIKVRLSTYQPPIFIDSVSQFNSTTINGSQGQIARIKEKSYDNAINNYPNSVLDQKQLSKAELVQNETSSSQSVVFRVNVTNKNPVFTYHNITPHLLANFTGINLSYSWEPPVVSQLAQNESSSFLLNITLHEPALLQGNVFFKINCSEGYYDAYAQPLALDYRVTTQNITIETRLENQTITVLENQTIFVLENQTTYVIDMTTVLDYTYDRQAFDTLKWIGLLVTFILLMSFLTIYVKSREANLRNLASKLRSRMFKDQASLMTALQREGINILPGDISSVMASADNLDQLGDTIFDLTGEILSPELLIKLASGASIEQIASRLNYVTGIPTEEIIAYLKEASSVESLLEQFDLDSELFLDIIARDEDVIKFQENIRRMIASSSIISEREITGIMIYEDIDIARFKMRLKDVFRSR